MNNSDKRGVCQRCGVVHTSKPFDLDEAVRVGAAALRDQIEADILALVAAKQG